MKELTTRIPSYNYNPDPARWDKAKKAIEIRSKRFNAVMDYLGNQSEIGWEKLKEQIKQIDAQND